MALPLVAAVFLVVPAAPPLSAQTVENAQAVDIGAAADASQPEGTPAPSPAVDALERKRDETRTELDDLSKTLTLSADKARSIEQAIAALDKSSASIRQALIESAARRKQMEATIRDSEDRLAKLRVKEDGIRASLHERRGVLAEVLAALQRMGRNPPPALLVTPEDALGSVRSAILLGAVVPGMRAEAERLMADLNALSDLQKQAVAEKEKASAAMSASLEEDRRMDLLLAENDKQSRLSAAELEAERRRSQELASRATSLQGLIQSLEGEISSVRDAMAEAREEEERRKQLTAEQREKAEQLAESGVPDKNRIAPAYPFASLKQKLAYPVEGDVLRAYGDPDGTGHPARGLTLAASPGAVVTAPADGLVVFAGAFRSYGQMIILNAGDGYHLVLTGMEKVNVRQGKFVFAGEPIAAMGEKRVASATALALETDRPTLYIEFRKDGTPVDSKPWWSAKETGRARNDS
ncbi:murein hydrolase activator EnvC [Rhizobium sp. CSW-27]|uniref:murein hydrolase activator EnvC family protein n=1 Tax=Rhizobium sp. CSW-27 TaxID=2839985 RepID=UPI001C0198C7|nr:murein hydrolase activator EnvC [Rhizobium sp. CSW-27]MBT9372681.1 murein hydrolase activator EnvC [Rhizobium sp. CSW-27]